MSKLLIFDTADATIRRKSDGRVFATAETQLTSLSQSLGINDKIYGGIGNKPLAVIKGQKEVTTTLRNAFYDQEFLSMTQGISIKENGTVIVQERENGLIVEDNNGDLEVTISGTPYENTGHIINAMGEVEEVAINSNTIIVPIGFASEGEYVSVQYPKEVTGDIIEMEADKFGQAYTIEYHTVGYDPATNEIVKDIYIQLDHVVPQGDFEMSLEAGTPIAPEFVFDCLAAPNTNTIGRIIEVDRK